MQIRFDVALSDSSGNTVGHGTLTTDVDYWSGSDEQVEAITNNLYRQVTFDRPYFVTLKRPRKLEDTEYISADIHIASLVGS